MIALASAQATEALGHAIGGVLRAGDVVTLSGPLGAGKTTFARGILAGIGFYGDVPSPSFAVVIPYGEPGMRLPLWHADLYRIENDSELDELGLEEGVADGALLIEWPEHGLPARWPEALALTFALLPDGARTLTASVPASWEGRWPYP